MARGGQVLIYRRFKRHQTQLVYVCIGLSRDLRTAQRGRVGGRGQVSEKDWGARTFDP